MTVYDDPVTDPSGSVDPDVLLGSMMDDLPEEKSDFSALRDDVERLKDSLARAQADYHNLSARVERDKAEMSFFFAKKYSIAFLPLADNLERALKHLPTDIAEHAWVSGIRATYTNFIKTFASFDVEGFDSIGHTVDPHRHDVIARTAGAEETIVDEYERGYTLGNQVIRHAKVIVGDGTIAPTVTND